MEQPPKNKFEKYKTNLKQRFKAHEPVKLEMEKTGENRIFYSIKLTGEIADYRFETPVIAFKTNLEEEADINRQEHNEEHKTEKTKELASRDQIKNFFKTNLIEEIRL